MPSTCVTPWSSLRQPSAPLRAVKVLMQSAPLRAVKVLILHP
jgi:hypothetical protein